MFAATRGGVALDPNTVFYVGSASGTTSIDLSGLGLQQGDIVVAATGWGSYFEPSPVEPSITTSGYTNVLNTNNYPTGDALVRLWIGYKVMGVTPDSSVSATNCNTYNGTITNSIVSVWRRIDPTTPLAATTTSAVGNYPAKVNSPNISFSGGVIILSMGIVGGGSVYGAPSGMSNYVTRTNGTGDANSTIAVASAYSTADSYDPATFETTNGGSEGWIAATLALKLT